MTLKTKSIHDLRTIAQSFGIADIFSKDKDRLLHEIELKQQSIAVQPKVEIEKPVYDARLMTKPPAKMFTEDEAREILKPYIEVGMRLTFPQPEVWELSFATKKDSGSMRMPLRVFLGCAERLIQ